MKEYRERESERQKGRNFPAAASCLRCLQHLEVGKAELRSFCQEFETSSIIFLIINRQLDQKSSSQDMSWNQYKIFMAVN